VKDYDQSQAFGGVIDVLEAIEAQYAIWGGLAVVAYGEPRFTHDMDILLSPDGFAAALFVRRLHGPTLLAAFTCGEMPAITVHLGATTGDAVPVCRPQQTLASRA
jgi:hypothetical protein